MLKSKNKASSRSRCVRRLFAAWCAVMLFFGLLSFPSFPAAAAEYTKYSGTFFEAFDTVTVLTGYTLQKETFDAAFDYVRSLFFHYHRIFDNYHEYENVKNLRSMNINAPNGYTEVEPELMELLLWLKEHQSIGQGRVNVAMGSVLSIWHRYRTEGTSLPGMEELQAAAAHTDFDRVLLNAKDNTVFYEDPGIQIDLGAVAKGYTVEIAASWLEKNMPSYIISAGGNVRCGASPLDGRQRWGVSIQDPDDTAYYLDVIYLKELSVVTSGDYQRYYTVDGVNYHHIIDPDTLMPSTYMRSVTVVTRDSGLADLLSTSFFNLSYEDGAKLAASLEGTEVYWVLKDGTVKMTEGFSPMLRSNGAKGKD